MLLTRNNFYFFLEALISLQVCLHIRETVLAPNHHHLGQAHDAVAQCLAMTGKQEIKFKWTKPVTMSGKKEIKIKWTKPVAMTRKKEIKFKGNKPVVITGKKNSSLNGPNL